MPSTSRKQEIAMQIAAAGKSNIGIPQKVGKEFAAADRRKKMSGGSKKGYSTGGTVSGAVGNPEYRHDPLNKSRNPQTRGSKKTGYATGSGSRNKQTPDNYNVQDGASKMQKCMVEKMRTRKSPGSVSSSAFRSGLPHNPHRGGY